MDPDKQNLGDLLRNTREIRTDLDSERRDRDERNAINSGLDGVKKCVR